MSDKSIPSIVKEISNDNSTELWTGGEVVPTVGVSVRLIRVTDGEVVRDPVKGEAVGLLDGEPVGLVDG